MFMQYPCGSAKAQSGYGLVLLIVFLVSTVLIGASLQMVVGPVGLAYLGSSSQDNLSAQELAAIGMETVLADIQTRLNTNQTVDTSYTYSSTSVTMPQDPASLGGSSSTVGSYSATMTAARGDTYLVKVTAVVGQATASVSRLIHMNRNNGTFVLDSVSGAVAAYSVRKLRTAYSGSAIRVRRASDNTEQDIGFDAAGNLDIDALKTFVSDSPPVTSVSGASIAYGLRKLRDAYTGSAIRVRRSSDNTEQDIGFTSTGDLDMNALLDFVGTGSGYVKSWYDQSGNSYDATQSTSANQPRIVNAGVPKLMNGRPAMEFTGGYLTASTSGLPSGSSARTMNAVYQLNDTTNLRSVYEWGSNANGQLSGIFHYATLVTNKNMGYHGYGSGYDIDSIFTNDLLAHATTIIVNSPKVYTFRDSQAGNIGYPTALSTTASTTLYIGTCVGASSSYNTLGQISEMMIYSSALSNSNRQIIERNQMRYYQIPMQWQGSSGYYAPNSVVTGASAAFSLRRLGSYSGNLILVRRSSDNAESNIGYDAWGNLDVPQLLYFVGNSSGYVKTMYDQSGNGYDATQTTTSNQPMIVNSGALVTVGGMPAMKYDGGDSLRFTRPVSDDFTIFCTFSTIWGIGATGGNWYSHAGLVDMEVAGGTSDFGTSVDSNGTIYSGVGGSPDLSTTVASPGYNDGKMHQFYMQRVKATGAFTLSVDNTSSSATSTNTTSLTGAAQVAIGGLQPGWNNFSGYINEVLIYPSATAYTKYLSANQMGYWNVNNSQAGDLYVKTWYDQSGNGNDLTLSNSIGQPVFNLSYINNINKEPILSFNGGQALYSATGMVTNSDYSKSVVYSYSNSTGTNNILSSYSGHALFMSASNYPRLYHGSIFVTSGTAQTTNTLYSVLGNYVESTKGGTIYQTNSSSGTGTASSSNTDASILLGSYGNSSFLIGSMSEAIIFNKVLSTSERTLLYNDQQSYFGAQ